MECLTTYKYKYSLKAKTFIPKIKQGNVFSLPMFLVDKCMMVN